MIRPQPGPEKAKIKKEERKSNPQMHSLQKNKKAVLTTAAYFKISSPERLQRQ